eukprot:4965989-Amphidinium_carterae.2
MDHDAVPPREHDYPYPRDARKTTVRSDNVAVLHTLLELRAKGSELSRANTTGLAAMEEHFAAMRAELTEMAAQWQQLE